MCEKKAREEEGGERRDGHREGVGVSERKSERECHSPVSTSLPLQNSLEVGT